MEDFYYVPFVWNINFHMYTFLFYFLFKEKEDNP